MKKPRLCHPEEPQAVLSETKEGSLQLIDAQLPGFFAEFILSEKSRFFASLRMTERRTQNDTRRAQNDSAKRFFISLLGRPAAPKAAQPARPRRASSSDSF